MSQNIDIFCVSLLILFLETLIIRWVSTEVRIFAYLHNMVLIATFLGIGFGCCATRLRMPMLLSSGALCLLVLGVQAPITGFNFKDITAYLGTLSQSPSYWYLAPGSLAWKDMLEGCLLLNLALVLIALVFFPLGQRLASLLQEHPQPVVSYSCDILGSLAGVWLFSLLSLLWLPPWTWFVAAALLYLLVLPRGATQLAGLLLTMFAVAVIARAPAEGLQTVWSPYQKLTLTPARSADTPLDFGYYLRVNGVWFQAMVNLSPEWVQQHRESYRQDWVDSAVVSLPYRLQAARGHLDNVLILGSGSGHDIAAALRAGAKHVVAVEIDPSVLWFGRHYHPNHPYDDPRVTVVVDDARAYLRRSREKFDVIRFGFLDSHTQSSSFNNLRLDNYVYTLESFEEARRRLTTDGIVAFSFAVEARFMHERFSRLLTMAFEHQPLCYYQPDGSTRYGRGGFIFLASTEPIQADLEHAMRTDPVLAANYQIVPQEATTTAVATDDWPYMYLEKPGVPKEYILMTISFLVLVVLLRHTVLPRGVGLDWHFFFLGAAFLLLEVHTISRVMLSFGTTWIVNAWVISAVLFLILLANIVSTRLPKKSESFVFLGLLLAVLLNFIPVSAFNALDYMWRATLSSFFLCLPVFFAGLIFMRSFSMTPRRDMALGSNLIGAIIGGLFESLSFAWGMQAITTLVFILYLLAMVSAPRWK